MPRDIPRVLSIAGTDPTGGAGIQADLKSIAANGGYGMAVVTALVAQNTRGVRSVHTPPTAFLREQLDAVSDDVAIDAVKIGMLGDTAVTAVVRAWLEKVRPDVVVLDPVMIATSGDRLLEPDAESALRALVPLAHLVTPNLPELAVLVDEPEARSWPEALAQGRRLSRETGTVVLVKGGHLTGADCPDALVDASGAPGRDVHELSLPRIDSPNTHGTGCSLSSAMATVQARTGDWARTLGEVKQWLHGALERSGELDVGRGNGPVHHFHAAHVQPASRPFSEIAWERTLRWREGIFGLGFIRELADGSLPRKQFSYYLAQDARYLNAYSRVLARASALAPTEAEQLFWAQGARTCLEVETALHRSWLAEYPAEYPAGGAQGPVTKAYVDHLMATSAAGSYAVLAAAALPCYWLYAEVGQVLHRQFVEAGRDAAHPYAAWMETYADEAFAEATRAAIAAADSAYAQASARERAAMLQAFEESARYEMEFFDAPRLYA